MQGRPYAVTGDLSGVSGQKWRRPLAETNDGIHIVALLEMGIQVHWAVERPAILDKAMMARWTLGRIWKPPSSESTITSKPGVEALAQQQSLLAAIRERTKPRKRWVKAAR